MTHRATIVLLVLTVLLQEGTTGQPEGQMPNKDDDEDRLFAKLFSKYNPNIRPVIDKKDTVVVKLGISLHQLIDVHEKNQVLKISVWMRQSWNNPLLTWNATEYGNIRTINVDPKKIWKPDLYLYNNADTNYDGALDRFKTKVVLSNNGRNMWLAPAIFSSSCKIDVTYFPFDQQYCPLKFGSWTYDGFRLDVQREGPQGDIQKFVSNGEWSLIGLPSMRNEILYVCCPEPYPDVTFTLIIRRRTMFYYVNLIIPCFLISALTLLSFFLPPESGERITLVITNLLSMTVFMLLVAEIMPPTSEVVPLISKYYAGTMFEVALSLVATCLVLKCYFMNPTVSKVPVWAHIVVITWLGRLLKVHIPPALIELKTQHKQNIEPNHKYKKMKQVRSRSIGSDKIDNIKRKQGILYPDPPDPALLYGNVKPKTSLVYQSNQATFSDHVSPTCNHKDTLICEKCDPWKRLSQEVNLYTDIADQQRDAPAPQRNSDTISLEMLRRQEALIDDVRAILNIANEKKEEEINREEWKLIASIIDTFFLWLFLLVLAISTITIFLMTPDWDDKAMISGKT